jgi:imidazolonepropionase-like amidohydrolase
MLYFMRILLALVFLMVANTSFSQVTFPLNGTKEKNLTTYLFINATVHVSADVVIENGQLAVHNDVITEVGKSVKVPANVVTIDLNGYHIYPSLIDLDSDLGMPESQQKRNERGPQFVSSKKGAFGWNEAVRPEVRAAELFVVNEEKNSALKAAGVGTVLTHVHDGIARGTAALVTTNSNQNKALLKVDVASWLSFRKGSSTQDYPGSLMGCIALIRQTYLDGQWYANGGHKEERNLSLEAWNGQRNVPVFFETRDRLDVLRADKIGDEFNEQYIFVGSGDEYMRIDEIKGTNGKFIIPLNFPAAQDVADPYLARLVSLSELKHWELAPSNPARLFNAGVPFALTSKGLKSPGDLMAAVRQAIEAGLPANEALRALTETPALMIGAADLIGKLGAGMHGNFLITDGELFEEKTKLFEHWVQGERSVLIDMNIPDLTGKYDVVLDNKNFSMEVEGSPNAIKGSLLFLKNRTDSTGAAVTDSLSVPVKLMQDGDLITGQFGPVDDVFPGIWRFSGNTSGEKWMGVGEKQDGSAFDFSCSLTGKKERKKTEDKAAEQLSAGDVTYPFIAYGWTEKPETESVWYKNATIWTCEADGKIENGQMIVHNGKIVAVGKDLDPASVFGKKVPNLAVFDATGMHISPGIIDEHSHIAISRGVNEWTQTSSAEVCVGDVVDSEDIDIYRQLSGGVTTSQLLHGSANPIGGQSGIIKLRWGLSPEEMRFENAAPFIKFALGENVKQSNSGDYNTIRFPQTRMGVEQVYYDMFIQAREYGAAWDAYEADVKAKKKNLVAPRRDIEMEVLLQILEKERFVTCHSYRQDEINMLMHVADSMGFSLNTFTHILEGYKVADKMAEHGAGASSFSDWWAYKYEVKDAIPYNGAILWEHGVTTAFNSDDAEMARRLNQEAAKAVKYGGVPEEEALKFVTLNPAILLHIDDKVGSLKAGKDADFVIWNDNPLSIYAVAQKTFVDGRCYFDREADSAMRSTIRAERARIIQKMLSDKTGSKVKPKEHMKHHYHCDSQTEEIK